MNSENVLNTLNTVSEKLFKSIEGEVFTQIDKLININPELIKESPLKEVMYEDKINGIILIADSLILFFILYFIISKLISVYNSNNSHKTYVFIIRLIIVMALVHSSYYICLEIINLVNQFTICVDEVIKSICGKYANFEMLKENILAIKDLKSSDLLSLNGIIKGIISFGSISILINFSIRYVTIIFLIIISPLAIVSLSSELTIGVFKVWIKNLITLLFTQIIVKFIIFIPLLYKNTNSTMYKIILVGSIYILYKINNFTKELFIKITSDLPKTNIFNG